MKLCNAHGLCDEDDCTKDKDTKKVCRKNYNSLKNDISSAMENYYGCLADLSDNPEDNVSKEMFGRAKSD